LHGSQSVSDRRIHRGSKPGPGPGHLHTGPGDGIGGAALQGRLAQESQDRHSIWVNSDVRRPFAAADGALLGPPPKITV
jgi:hypothetical protein